MSSIKILITRPEHDVVTQYLSNWSQDVILKAEEKGIKCKDLGADKVTRQEFEKIIKNTNPTYVLFNGHGDSDNILGHNDEPIVILNVNDDLFKDKIIYAVACHSGSALGPSFINKGALSFIGYTEKFAFLTNTSSECVPEDDNLAIWFKEASNEVSYSLLKGNTTKIAYDISQAKYKELIRKFSSSTAMLEAQAIRFWLFWDMQNQVILGNLDAII